MRNFSHSSIDNKQHFIGHKTPVNNGYKQLFKSTELSNDLLPKNERVYRNLSFYRNFIKKHRFIKHRVLRKDKMEKRRTNALDADEAITASDQCISPQSSHSSADDPQT
jgi:hypothetical protein